MSHLIKVVVLVSLFLFGCSAEKKFQKAVNKFGQKESVKFITEKYPEYFITKRDTVRDTVIVKEIKADTLLIFRTDTITYTKDKIVIRLIRTGKDSINLNVKVPGDTIYIVKPCPEQKLPDTDKLKTVAPPKWSWAFPICFILFLIILWKWQKV